MSTFKDGKPIERIVAEDTREAVNLRFHRLTSSTLCRKMLASRWPLMTDEVLNTKSEGVAWAVRSALGYWEINAASLNAKSLTRYYAILQVTIAELVAKDTPDFTLANIQKHTENGHGLFTLQGDGEFPENYYIGCLSSGHFAAYLKSLNVDISKYVFERRPRIWSEMKDEDREKLISLGDLLRRVPELQNIVSECIDKPALSFHIHYASKNTELKIKKMTSNKMAGDIGTEKLEAKEHDVTTYVDVYVDPDKVSTSWLGSLGLPFINYQIQDEDGKDKYFVAELHHPDEKQWWAHIDTYKSGLTGTAIIAPFWGGITDTLILHLIILYALSIVVRYLPSLWHEIEDGNLDHIRVLLESYLSIVDAVLPLISVERIANVRLVVTMPGSLFAPV